METLLRTVLRRWRRSPRSPRSQVQLLSDLHLEIGQQYSSYTFPVSAPFLLLAGDIGRLIDYDGYRQFLEAQVCRYKKVFLVLGNHEFYGLDYSAGIDEACRLAKEPSLAEGLILLHKTRWDDADSALTILGCTLWSAIPDQSSRLIESAVNDFKHIGGWTAQRHNEIHTEEAAWLREQVARVSHVQKQVRKIEGWNEGEGDNKGKKSASMRLLLVATHHAPSKDGTSRPCDANSPWTPAFATDLLGQRGWEAVKVWAYGHTHYSTDFRVRRSNVRVVANQRGYVFPNAMPTPQIQDKKVSKKARDFDPAMVITM
ncbi:hypothetical protein E4U43_008401 [Claviceps pusilla]|uniref:Calcineurin-like phosphoesterase domain-containing protein n=1 Tax=Claviceps pusilla TaxID=123648 RepID=A0A9P7ND86_9HYPO|nr:hypothetical protein E4U43_008401 [Claviceps pusilla]